MAGLRGLALAREARTVFERRGANYPTGITVEELDYELRLAGIRVLSDNVSSALGSALNGSQPKGIWRNVGDGRWLPGDDVVKGEGGLKGKALADALYEFVRVAYPAGEFHYDRARVRMERETGVVVEGTGKAAIAALAGAPDRFVKLPGDDGLWRWK